jgi:hypothetical protein
VDNFASQKSLHFLSVSRDVFSQIEWAGHGAFMGDMRNLYKISVGKLGGKKHLGDLGFYWRIILHRILKI